MTPQQLMQLPGFPESCNLHSHTQYCDGHATLAEMAAAAAEAGLRVWGVSPHSPIPESVASKCNMRTADMERYLADAAAEAGRYADRMSVLTALEVDFLGPDWGPHIDYFQKLPLHYRIGSVHFVPNQDGVLLDCDGSSARFAEYLRNGYGGDLRYVVEKYFEQVLLMLERGGFELLGHFDKIAGNASSIDPGIEDYGWYAALVDDVISHASRAGVAVEINTKALADRNRFYPSLRWWQQLVASGLPIAVNSDAHWPDKVNAGRCKALELLADIRRDIG